jgi:hypothetical protein
MPVHRTLHLDVVAVVGRKEIGTNEEQNYISILKIAADLLTEITARVNSPIMPRFDQPLPFQNGKMFF